MFVPTDQATNGCWVACISSITGIPLSDLPQAPTEPGERNSAYARYHNDVIRQLSRRGWALAYLGRRCPSTGYCIGSGPSPRYPEDSGIHHAVVIKDGKPYFDPHPSREFVPEITEYEVLIPCIPYTSDEHEL